MVLILIMTKYLLKTIKQLYMMELQFVVIVGAVILILILVVEYTSEVKMFPRFHSSD